jgi:UDP-N-acetylglucosamine 2-epimerase
MTIAGTRPEVIKLSEFVKHFRDMDHAYVYTGQHYSSNMKDIFFDELGSQADVDLKCNTSNTSAIEERITGVVQEMKPSLIVVYGDTNSTLAGAQAAARTGTTLVHIEAGLRSFDLRMPEERNRIEVDFLSQHLLCPTNLSREFLSYEGKTRNVSVTGNLIVDVCNKFAGYVAPKKSSPAEDYLLLTLHREENADNASALLELKKKLLQISDYKIIFPIHPRTRKNLLANNIELPQNVVMIDPTGYLDFLALLKNCNLVLTDSGGVQEEAVILGKPCITLRTTTERWETILMGANRLYPLSSNEENLKGVIDSMVHRRITSHPYGEEVTLKTVEKVKEIAMRPSVRFVGK